MEAFQQHKPADILAAQTPSSIVAGVFGAFFCFYSCDVQVCVFVKCFSGCKGAALQTQAGLWFCEALK